MKPEKLFDYDPSQSEFELAKDNMMFLVVHGDGYTADEIPENDILDIESPTDERFVLNNYKMQRLAYFKEIELAEEWDLEDEFLDTLWGARKGEWHTYNDLSGRIWFKCMEEK
jgi:hypothetical protein